MVKKAAEAANTSVTTVWRERKGNSDFAKEYAMAITIAASRLRDEVLERAFEGKPCFQYHPRTGEPLLNPVTGRSEIFRNYSDKLLIFLLRSLEPETYGCCHCRRIPKRPQKPPAPAPNREDMRRSC